MLISGPIEWADTPITSVTFANRVYNGSAQSTEVASVNPAGATYTLGGTTSATNVGTYSASVTGTGSFSGTANDTWQITPADQSAVSISPTSQTITAGGSITFTASGGNAGNYVWDGEASGTGSTKSVSFPAAGTYNVSVYRAGDSNYNASNTASATITVTAANRAPTVSLSAPGSVYVGDPVSLSASASDDDGNLAHLSIRVQGSGLVYSEPASGATASGSTVVTAPSTPGIMNVRAEVVDSGGLGATDPISGWAEVTVLARPTTPITSVTFADRVYNGSAQSTEVTSVNPAGATYTLGGTTSATNVGTYSASVTGTGSFSGTANDTWQITPANQTVSLSASATSVTPGSTVNFTASGGQNGYNWEGEASGTGSTKSVTFPTAGNYNVGVSSPAGGNYNASNTASITITVTDDPTTPTTFSISPTTFTYDGTPKSVTVSASPAGATFTTGGTTTATNVGTYTATAAATGSYSGSNSGLTWTITKANQSAVSISPTSQTITAGGSITFTASGGNVGNYVWGGEASGTGSTKSVTFPTAGNYNVTVYRAGDSNYNASNTATATITVTAAPLNAITVTAGSPSKVYDGQTLAVPAPTVTAGTIAPGHTLSVSGRTTLVGPAAGTYATSPGTVIVRDLGNNDVTSSYSITVVQGAAVIARAPLLLKADNKSIAQGSPIPSLTWSTSGYVNGETSAILTGTPTISTTATAASGQGSYPISIGVGSLAAPNYQISTSNGTITITATPTRDLSVTWGPIRKE